jgi:WhiB family transcriptional regulator, redox-sensing transcriptional regulator
VLADLTTEDQLPTDSCPDDLPCWTADPDLWFAESPADVETAKALCGPCPLRDACLAGALEREEPWGVWGGQLLVSGTVVPRKRPRGRPSKSDLARDAADALALQAALAALDTRRTDRAA